MMRASPSFIIMYRSLLIAAIIADVTVTLAFTVCPYSTECLFFPIKPTEGITEVDIGNSLAQAFGGIAQSSEFFESSSQIEEGHRRSSFKMPCFGDTAKVTFEPCQSTYDEYGSPTEYVVTTSNFQHPLEDFGNLCLEIYKYREGIMGEVSITDLREKVLAHLNSLPPDPGYDADLTSSKAIGNDELAILINRMVDSNALTELKERGYVVIERVMSTSQSSNDRLRDWSDKSRTDQGNFRTDTVTFLKRDDAIDCGVGEQYDLLSALASHLNDNLDLYSSPYKPILPGTVDRPLTNPSNGIQMAEYGRSNFYDTHSDNSIDRSSGSASSLSSDNSGSPKRRSNYRCITAILYLNEGWEESDGGQLRMYLDSADVERPQTAVDTHEYVDINPSNGKLLLFDSRMVHSVKKVVAEGKTRRALTIWITRPEESGVTGEEYYLKDNDE